MSVWRDSWAISACLYYMFVYAYREARALPRWRPGVEPQVTMGMQDNADKVQPRMQSLSSCVCRLANQGPSGSII